MSAVTTVATALLAAPPLALLGLAFGMGHRFGRGAELWPGAVAVAAAVIGATMAAHAGWVGSGVLTVLAAAVSAAAGPSLARRAAAPVRACPCSGPPVRSRRFGDGMPGDRRSAMAAPVAVAVAAVAVVVLVRGDGPVEVGPARTVVVAGREVAGSDAVTSAVVAAVALLVIGVLVLVPGVRLRLDAAARRPALLRRVGTDPDRVTALLRAGTAAVAALAGVALTGSGEVRPGDAVALTVVGAEVALLGGAGSVPGALVAATALSLWRAAGDAVAPGWGPLAGHAVVAVVLVVRHARSSSHAAAPSEVVP